MTVSARIVVQPQEPAPLQIIELDLPAPGPHQVVVKQYASGVCHSQLHQMHNPRQNPIVLGHESTGEVLSVGSEVRRRTPTEHRVRRQFPCLTALSPDRKMSLLGPIQRLRMNSMW